MMALPMARAMTDLVTMDPETVKVMAIKAMVKMEMEVEITVGKEMAKAMEVMAQSLKKITRALLPI